ncbi:MAG TPA: efflux RND transporter periplasmic adaptor subunit [Terriglobales bacterium]|nr:efflux RND transporter periplasmic adaptor subunit [Terriglobales bacterium]
MATQRPGYAIPYADLATALLATSEVAPRARLLAEQVSNLVPGGAVVIYILDENGAWAPKATAGEVAYEESAIEFGTGTLGAMAERNQSVLFTGSALTRESYSHLNVRRTVVSLASIPLLVDERLVGAIEVLTFDEPITEVGVAALTELAQFAALGLAAGVAYENERNTQLQSITRITQMYDLEKVFNATLEMDQLLPVIASKFQEVMNVQAVNLWLVEDEALVLMSRAGDDAAYELEARQATGEGIVADVADSGEGVCISSADDERLRKRNAQVEEGEGAFSVVAAPIIHQDSVVGVAEAINKNDGSPFDEDDLFLLTTICETAANALHNAELLQTERKVEILELLVQVSQEITSTLNLDRVLQTIVNGTQAVIPFERAALALEERGKLRLRAVSGMQEESVDLSNPDLAALNDLLLWASTSLEEIHVRQHGDEIDDPREETRAKFTRYFEQTGLRGFYAVPLSDDTGRVGVLSFESRDPDFLSTAHLEIIRVLAGQATVALRNAQMYKEVPFIGILEPILQKKRKFFAMEKRSRQTSLMLAGAVLAFLAVVPLPMRVDGDATVAPTSRARIQPEVEGVVRKVYVREGDAVTRGTILADLEDWDYRSALAGAEAKFNTAVAEMNRALASNDGTEAGIQRVQADYWASEVKRARERLERTRLRAPIDGVVATPHVENFVGRHLEAGDDFAELVDSSRAVVDVRVPEKDVALLEAGHTASVKLLSFPTRTFRGRVVVVSPKGEPAEDERFFYARVALPNADGAIRAGMQGRSKVWVGWRPAGYVMFRGSAMWIWSKLWSWFGW